MNVIKHLYLISFYLVVLNPVLCNKKHICNKSRSSYEESDQSNKCTVKIKVIIAPCSTDQSAMSGKNNLNILGCKKKLIIKIKIISVKKVENKVLSIRDVTDYNTNRKLQLLHPLVIKIKQNNVFELYPLEPKKNINGLVREEVINNENKNFTGCETDTATTSTCGYSMIEDSIIPFSEGFCCSCDPKVNKLRQPSEIQHRLKRNIHKLESDHDERESQNKTKRLIDQDDKSDLDYESDDFTNSNEMLTDVKLNFHKNLSNLFEKTPAKNVINITVKKESLKHMGNKNNEYRQIRGHQKCDHIYSTKEPKRNNYYESAHCLRFSELWYTAFKIGKAFIDDQLSIKVYAKQEFVKPNADFCWEDLTKHFVMIGSLRQTFLDENSTVSAIYKAVGIPSFSLKYFQSYILIPQPLSQEMQKKIPPAKGHPEQYLILNEDEITFDGKECDKAGVSFEAFARQPGRCFHKRQSCLKNQPIKLWMQDMKSLKSGKKGKYFLKNYAENISLQPIFANRSSGEKLLRIGYSHNFTRVVELHVKADHITLIKSGSFGQISQVYIDALEHNYTQITAVVMNLDLTAASFKISLMNCSDDIPDEEFGDKNDLIPPQHEKTFDLTLSGVLSSVVTECKLQMLNIDKVVLASRRIVLKKDHRCVCAWHCQCVCDTNDHLPCIPLSLDEYNQAGYLGHLPSPTYKSYPKYVSIIQCLVCVIFMMIVAGVMKAIVGLCFPSIANWGLWIICPQKARALRDYYEREFFHYKVHYDADGFPLHPEKLNRNVKFMPWYSAFLLNCIFFIWALVSIFVYKCSTHKCYESLSSSETEHLISGRYVTSCPQSKKTRYSTPSKTTTSSSGYSMPTQRKSRKYSGTQEYLAINYVNELIERYFVFRNMNRPLGGVNFIPGSPYSIRGFFLCNENGNYEFNPPSPFKQYWMMDRTPLKPPLDLNPKSFYVIYNTAEDVLLANEVTLTPRGVVINMR